MNIIRKTAISSIVFISILGAITFQSAYLYAGIGVSPENIEMVVSEGRAAKGAYTVVNDSDAPAHVKVEVEDWLKARLGKSGIPVEQWLQISPMEFDMEPKETRKIEYIITPPKGQEGELAAMVFFGTPSSEGGFNITSRFGVSIYIAIENTIRLACSIKDITVSRDVADPKKELNLKDKRLIFDVDVENSGNVHIRPTGNIEIVGENGTSDNVKIGRGFPVYPGKSLNYGIPWDKKDIAPGKYNATITLDCGSLYKIDKRIEKKTSFIVKEDGTVSF